MKQQGKLRLVDNSNSKEFKVKLSPAAKNAIAVKDRERATQFRLNRKTKESVEANFGENAHKIIELLEQKDNDTALTLLQRKLLQTTIEMIPYAEEQIRVTGAGKGVYQFNILVSQVRELIGDLQAQNDKQYVAQRIVDTVLRPIFMDMAQEIISEHHGFSKSVDHMIQPRHHQGFSKDFMLMAKELAKMMQIKYDEAANGIKTTLQN